jgi:hypothetical protein
VTNIVDAFEHQVNIHQKSSRHSHKSSASDEAIINKDLRDLRPFKKDDERSFESFKGISHDPTHTLNKEKFKTWMSWHKKNLLMHFPVIGDTENEHEEEVFDMD